MSSCGSSQNSSHDRKQPEQCTVTILHTNDFHGRHLPIRVYQQNATSQTGAPGAAMTFDRTGRLGGFAHVATAVKRLREQRGPENVILLHGGDTFSDDMLGNLTRGEAMIQLMNAAGYGLMALGNHDFDYGTERTEQLQSLARFPMRAANVVDKSTGAPFLGDPTALFDAPCATVGVLTLGYHNTPQTTSAKNIEGLVFKEGIGVAQSLVPDLHERADIVVVLSHQGTKVDEVLAREVPGIDVIIGAHSHDRIAPARRVGDVWIAQALSDALMVGELVIRTDGAKITSVAGAGHLLWNDEVPPDPEVAELIDALRAPYRDRLEEIIATGGEPIGRRYKFESPFDKLVGRILREETGSQIALLPGVGYGVTLPQGAIAREDLIALLPHSTKVVTLTLTGEQIREILEQSATNLRPPDPLDIVGGLIQTDGMRWTIDLTRPVGKRISDVFVADEPLKPKQRYTVVTHKGMLGGIHRYETFSRGDDIETFDQEVAEVVAEELKKRDTVLAPEIGDITFKNGE